MHNLGAVIPCSAAIHTIPSEPGPQSAWGSWAPALIGSGAYPTARSDRRSRPLLEYQKADLLIAACSRGELRWRRGGLVAYLLNPATRLIVIAMITAPKTNAISACRRTAVRMIALPMSVSETWKVIPTVKAT